MIKSIPTNLQSVSDFLAAVEWVFKADYGKGQHLPYHWLHLQHHIDLTKFLIIPSVPYQILVTHFEGFGTADKVYASTERFFSIGKCALTVPITSSPPVINYGADTTLIWLDKEIPPHDLVEYLKEADVQAEQNNPDFWKFIQSVDPYFFQACSGANFFVARDKAILDNLCSPAALSSIEKSERTHLKAYRRSLWRNLGPESGPETCVDAGCERLRIPLAVRCFLHQLNAFK